MRILSQSPLWRRLARVAGSRLFHWAENNGDSDFNRNGEQWLLEQLFAGWAGQPYQTRVVFDVGANVGNYSEEVLRLSKRLGISTSVYAFEPGTAARDALSQRFGLESSVTIVGAAVGERAGKKHLYFDFPGSSQASLINRTQAKSGGEEVDVVRLGEYITGQGIKRIDLMKLDVEGAERPALMGLGDSLTPDLVSVIQFEYGGATLDAGCRLRHFYDLLVGQGYIVAKLFPQSLEVRRYDPWMDHFWYANYVAMPPAFLDALPQ